MYTFLIETDENGEFTEDFTFEMNSAIKFNKWYYGKDNLYEARKCHSFSEYSIRKFDGIPVGSLEFTIKFMKIKHNIDLTPIYIPEELKKEEFLKRKIVFNNFSAEMVNKKWDSIFVKEYTKFKGTITILKSEETAPEGIYCISDCIDIDSEWRVFIYNGEIVGCQNYSGDFMNFPNHQDILNMISAYTNSPKSYTLDIGILEGGGTALIEVHDIFSCGLYGFGDYKLLPKMYISWFKSLVK